MGLDFYTGLNAVPGDDTVSTLFNKTAINTDNVYERIRSHAAMLTTSYQAVIRSYAEATLTGGLPSVTGQTPGFELPFDTLQYQSDPFWSENKATQISIPANFSSAQLWLYGSYGVDAWQIIIRHFKASGSTRDFYFNLYVASKYYQAQIFTPRLPVSPGDYFKAYVNVPGTGTVDFDQKDIADGGDYNGSLVTRALSSTIFRFFIRGFL